MDCEIVLTQLQLTPKLVQLKYVDLTANELARYVLCRLIAPHNFGCACLQTQINTMSAVAVTVVIAGTAVVLRRVHRPDHCCRNNIGAAPTPQHNYSKTQHLRLLLAAPNPNTIPHISKACRNTKMGTSLAKHCGCLGATGRTVLHICKDRCMAWPVQGLHAQLWSLGVQGMNACMHATVGHQLTRLGHQPNRERAIPSHFQESKARA
mgnify:CR=1 FL=1